MSRDAKHIRADTANRLTAQDAEGQWKTLAQDRVYPSRMLPIQDDELQEGPVLVITTPNETGNSQSKGNTDPRFTNEVTLQLEFTASAATDIHVEDLLDDLDEQGRETLMTDPVWLAQFEEVVRIETIKGLEMDGGRRHGVCLIRFTLKQHIRFEPIITDECTTTNIDVDMIDPHDPNTGARGPDGVIDVSARVPIATT